MLEACLEEGIGRSSHGKEEPASAMCTRDQMERELGEIDSQQTCLCWANVGPTFVVTLDQRRTPTLDQRCFAHWAYGGPTVGANHLPTFSQC